MHTVVVTRERASEEPDLVKAIYRGFCTAKDQMAEQYLKGMSFNNMPVMRLWFTGLIGRNRDLMGEDWWPYGVKADRTTIDALLRYHHEQGLSARRFTVEDIFVPYLLDN